MSSASSIRVLLVDVDREAANRLARMLHRHHPELELQAVGTVRAALDLLGRAQAGERGWDAIVCTAGKRHPDGIELARSLSESARRVPCLLLGDAGDLETAVEGIKVGASDFLVRNAQLVRHLPPRLRQAIDRMRVRQRHEMLLPALDALPDTVLVADTAGIILAASRACGPMFGLAEDELAGKSFNSLLELGEDHPLRAEIDALGPGASLQRELPARRSDGRTFESLLTVVRTHAGEPLLLIIFRDITRWREIQEQMVQHERLSALGELVSGVAHELNNPLTAILGFAQLTLGTPELPEKVRRSLRTILDQALRSERIVQNLLTFARNHKPEKRLLGINGVLESTVSLLDYHLRVDNIQVVRDLEPELPKIMADYHQLQQVFLNLINNAHQAMAMARQGTQIVLRTRSQEGWVRVEISDDGPGIPQEALPSIFDPFFTTKPAGVGTGLGLSLCYGTVSEHGGRIHARSQKGQGATFIVELPASRDEVAAGTAPPTGEPEPARSGRRSVLVADDEDTILELIFQLVAAEGHRVVTARNGVQALQKMEQEPYDLLITDIKMPGCDGRRLYERWCALHPERARSVLITTGDTAGDSTRTFLRDTGLRYIQKPFDVRELMDLVRRILNELPGSPAAGESGVTNPVLAPAGGRP